MAQDAGATQSVDVETYGWFEEAWFWILVVLYVAIIAILIGALAGLFGGGPLSRAQATLPSGAVKLAYERFARRSTQEQLVVDVAQSPADGLELVLDRPFADAMSEIRLTPEPAEQRPDADGIVYRFVTHGQPARIALTVRPAAWGTLEGRIIVAGATIPFSQFVWP